MSNAFVSASTAHFSRQLRFVPTSPRAGTPARARAPRGPLARASIAALFLAWSAAAPAATSGPVPRPEPAVVVATGGAAALASAYADAVRAINEEHARKPGTNTEAALAKKLPREAQAALAKLVDAEGPDVPAALITAGEAALDLDRIDDFEKVRARLTKLAPEEAKKLGIAVSRPRVLLLGRDGVEKDGLTSVADALDLVLDAYAAEFAFAEWSKIPGKKLRMRVHLVPKIENPPHFAPEPPFHSEIDFPVIDAHQFASPTKDGQFLLYGMAHELGHVIAMWGKSAQDEEDHHAWAHYTGLVIVEWLAKNRADAAPLKLANDARWRNTVIERDKLVAARTRPGLGSKEEVLELLFELHDMVGPKAIGAAINALDAKDERPRVNHVRYYTFEALGNALRALPTSKKKLRDLDVLFPRAGEAKGK